MPGLLFAGQITGVEGYMESTAMGLLAGMNAFRIAEGKDPVLPPPTTGLGALVRYVTHSTALPFQPMNINFGLLPPLSGRVRGRRKKQLLAGRALEELEAWKRKTEI